MKVCAHLLIAIAFSNYDFGAWRQGWHLVPRLFDPLSRLHFCGYMG
jgi:hypothetical protein